MAGFQSGAKIKGVADIVICVDCTGSMEPCIEEVKGQLGKFIDELKAPSAATQKAVDWRLRVIGYRDAFSDAAEAFVGLDNPMVGTEAEARDQVMKLTHSGGGDEPESALDALWYAAAKTPWRTGCTKVIVFFSDATALERMHPSTIAAGAVGGDASTVMQEVSNRGIYVYAWAPECAAWSALKNGAKVFLIPQASGGDGLKALNFADVLKTLAKTVSEIAVAPSVTVRA